MKKLSIFFALLLLSFTLVFGQRFLTKPSGVPNDVQLISQGYMFDSSGNLVLDGQARYLYNSTGTQVLDFSTKVRNLYPTVTASAPTTGDTITLTGKGDEFLYITGSGTFSALTISLPAVANATVGDRKVVLCNQTITTLTVNVSGSGTLAGASLSAGVANTGYEFICTSVAGNGTWVRVR